MWGFCKEVSCLYLTRMMQKDGLHKLYAKDFFLLLIWLLLVFCSFNEVYSKLSSKIYNGGSGDVHSLTLSRKIEDFGSDLSLVISELRSKKALMAPFRVLKTHTDLAFFVIVDVNKSILQLHAPVWIKSDLCEWGIIHEVAAEREGHPGDGKWKIDATSLQVSWILEWESSCSRSNHLVLASE